MSFSKIATTEQLKDYIHSIHDFIRNSGAGYGMTALKIFNVFYSLKNISGKCKNFGLDEALFEWNNLKKSCKASSIRDIVNKLRDLNNVQQNPFLVEINKIDSQVNDVYDKLREILSPEKFSQIDNDFQKLNKLFDSINNDKIPENTKNMAFFIYHQIPTNQDDDFYKEMYNLINNIPCQIDVSNNDINDISNKFDIKGKVYEYFIGRDESAISDLGAYFTDRYITNFIFDFIKPELGENSEVLSMIDPFGGSGGFTIQYTKHIDDEYHPDWSSNNNYKQVYHYDMSEDVVKVAGVEYYSITGYFPNAKKQFINTNTFRNEFTRKFKYVISNPPYGGDKTKKTVDQEKMEMIIKLNKEIIPKIETVFKNLVVLKVDTPTKKNNKNKIGYNFDYIQLINEINNITDDTNYNDNVIILFDAFCSTYSMNIANNIKLFQDVLNLYNINIDDKDDLFILMSRLYFQVNNLKKQINEEVDEQFDKKVNLNTCSDFIVNYALEIVNNNEITCKKPIINEINKELKLYGVNNIKHIYLKKSLDYYNSTPYKYELNDKFKDSYFKDKEACSLILLMNLVEDNGSCVGLLKDGVFFNSKYSILRGFLIHNYNVTDIISVPNKAFENTTTKTSIIVFHKNGSTTNINFWELDVEKSKTVLFKYNKLVGNEVQFLKEQIKLVDKKFLCKASFKQLCKVKTTYNKNNEPSFGLDYSFNYKDYMDYQVACPVGFEVDTLNNYLKFKPKSKRQASFADENGQYTFYTSSDKVRKCTELDYKDDDLKLIFGDGGNGSLFLDTKFTCSDHNLVCITNNKLITQYLYFYIKNNWNEFIFRMFNGSVIGNIGVEKLKTFKVPIPQDINTLKPQLEALYDLHLRISTMTQSIPDKEKHICNLIKRLTDEGKKGVDYDEYTLEQVCEVKAGPYLKSYNKGEYPIVGGGDISGYIDNYSNENDWVIHKDGISKKIISYIKNKFFVNHHGWTFKTKNDINKIYVAYWILIITNEIFNRVSGSNQKGLNQETFYKFIIRVLKPHIMAQHNIQQLFDEVDEMKTQLETLKQSYKSAINELFKDFTEDHNIAISCDMSTDSSSDIDNEDDDNDENLESEVNEKSNKPIIVKETVTKLPTKKRNTKSKVEISEVNNTDINTTKVEVKTKTKAVRSRAKKSDNNVNKDI
jgi:type I restriction-modification system DNA methylase subunit